MSVPLLDFQKFVEITEPFRQRQLEILAFDMNVSKIEWTVRDVIEELELLVDGRATMAPEEFIDGIREQARRLLK
ncbi:hypothetical protein [Brevibacillus choshinensis]|uniref:Uncharacterized protein n=1 Tax=Brevibacillus choshinensis TaxID=54911 RepID=A0ABX7FGE8_BRECH|nr:hypothetical protein [Brevibacillus choshinensis]QRG65278.1 hypothetical protein JNE38_16700 [Brevibacillus choshinensis]